ncbi:flagellar hook-length control protein FliK [Alkalibacillus flavidus]|uniref:Flagellar hook-length control protein FliK n=1 Tax=Alkalibacillus flavidus TaxID=546021 RepID=A0ABV2KRB8_9BACI
MNGLVTMMPTVQNQPMTNAVSSKSSGGQGFKNMLQNLSGQDGLKSMSSGETMSESDVKALLAKVQQALDSGDGDLASLVSQLSEGELSQLVNTINQLMTDSGSFMTELSGEQLNALGQLLLESHQQLSSETSSSQLTDVLKQLQNETNGQLSDLSQDELTNMIKGMDGVSLDQLGLSAEDLQNLLAKLEISGAQSITEDQVQQLLASMQEQNMSQFVLNGQTMNLQQVETMVSNGQNQLQQTEQALARVIAALFGQQQNMTSNQQSGSNEKWQQLLQQLQQQLNKQNLNQPSLQHRQDVTAIRQNLSQILNGSSSDQSMQTVKLDTLFGDNNQMSKIEQYTIHLSRATGQQSSGQTSNQQQMIEQLQKIIQSSNFGRANGANNVTIQMKPANLGQMTLQFMQIDGQMAVKISVMSQAAKDMLEGNLNQLRHMFQPHQVVIERQVDQTNTDFTKQHLNDEQNEDQEGQLFEEEQFDNSPDEDDVVEEPLSFRDLLINEEV